MKRTARPVTKRTVKHTMNDTPRTHDASNYLGYGLIVPQVFHRFSNLPTELRHKIYEQYFFGVDSAVACRSWPKIDYAPDIKYTASLWFLPELCFVSKALRSEVIDILLGPATVEISSEVDGRRVSEMVRRNINQQIFSMARRLSFTQINIPANREWPSASKIDVGLEIGESRKRAISARVSNMVHSQLIFELAPRFADLQELHLGFHTPTVSNIFSKKKETYAYPIDSLLRSFRPPSLGMPKLRRVTVSAHAGTQHLYGDKIIGGGPSYLRAVMVPAQKIKDDLAGWGRDVTVIVQLFYSRKFEETVLKVSKTKGLLALASSMDGMTIWDRLAEHAKAVDI